MQGSSDESYNLVMCFQKKCVRSTRITQKSESSMRAHCQTRHLLVQDSSPDNTLPIIKMCKTFKCDVHADLRVTKVAVSFIFPLIEEDEVLKEEIGSP